MKLKKTSAYQIIFIIITSIYMLYINITYADQQNIQIYSSYQSINILTNTIIFKTDVVLKFKQTTLYADKIMITHDQSKHNISMLQAFGNPVILNYIPKLGNITSGRAAIICYDSIKQVITFTGQARIEQSGNSIQSDNIMYSINQKTIHAFSKENRKTITVLLVKTT